MTQRVARVRQQQQILVMAALCNRQAIIFLPCGLFVCFFFFPRLVSAAADGISSILRHMV